VAAPKVHHERYHIKLFHKDNAIFQSLYAPRKKRQKDGGKNMKSKIFLPPSFCLLFPFSIRHNELRLFTPHGRAAPCHVERGERCRVDQGEAAASPYQNMRKIAMTRV
jgi:hypothetical protein